MNKLTGMHYVCSEVRGSDFSHLYFAFVYSALYLCCAGVTGEPYSEHAAFINCARIPHFHV